MLRYYIDADGDYLVVDHATGNYFRRIGQPNMREARATAIAGNLCSVSTASVSLEYLTGCREVPREDVPADWLERF